MSFLWGHWYPCFGLLVTSALGFKARVDSLACFLACMLFLRFTSGAIPADLLTASMAAEPLWPTYLQPSDVSTSIGGVEVGAAARTYGLGQGSNPRPTVPQHSALNNSTIPARLLIPWPLSRLLVSGGKYLDCVNGQLKRRKNKCKKGDCREWQYRKKDNKRNLFRFFPTWRRKNNAGIDQISLAVTPGMSLHWSSFFCLFSKDWLDKKLQ